MSLHACFVEFPAHAARVSHVFEKLIHHQLLQKNSNMVDTTNDGCQKFSALIFVSRALHENTVCTWECQTGDVPLQLRTGDCFFCHKGKPHGFRFASNVESSTLHADVVL